MKGLKYPCVYAPLVEKGLKRMFLQLLIFTVGVNWNLRHSDSVCTHRDTGRLLPVQENIAQSYLSQESVNSISIYKVRRVE